MNVMLHENLSREEWLNLRKCNINSTESAALFGLSKYSTAFEIAHTKLGTPEAFKEFVATERTTVGLAIQDAIASMVGARCGVDTRPLVIYAEDDDRLGSSFDYELTGVNDAKIDDERCRLLFAEYGPGILECKNVDFLIFRNEWQANDAGMIEAPDHIEIQVQHQMEILGREWCVIAVLVGGNRLEIIPRLRDRDVGAAIRGKIREFWQNLALVPPVLPPIELPEDVDIIKRLHGFAEPGKLLDARGDEEITALCAAVTSLGKLKKKAEDDHDSAKARLLMKIGDSEKVLADGFTVSAGLIGPAEIPACTRAGYRNLRVYAKKTAAKAAEVIE